MIKDKRIVAIIPARGGSKGVPRKNLRVFQGKSLLAWTIEIAKLSKYIDKVIVSSEDAEIIDEAKRCGAEVPFVRPKDLAEDSTPGIDPIIHALNNIEYFDYVIILQVTSPMRTVEDINKAINYCLQLSAPSCVSVVESTKHPYWMFTVNKSFQLKPLFSGQMPTRRQDLPSVFIPNGAIYFAQTDWLRECKKFITNETVAFLMSYENSLDIDCEYDFVLLEAMWRHRIETKTAAISI